MVKVIGGGRERWRFTACERLEALRIVLVCERARERRGSALHQQTGIAVQHATR